MQYAVFNKYTKIYENYKNEKDGIELTVNTFGSDEYKKLNFKAIESKDYVVDNFTYILPEKERKNYASYCPYKGMNAKHLICDEVKYKFDIRLKNIALQVKNNKVNKQ